jgi:ATP-dependent DNA helicase DinG
MVQRVASFLEEETHFTVLRQGNAPKSALLRDFRTRGDAVLVATMSFWQGVDVPGDALRLVIIDKIPFASPDDPVLSARMEWVESRGQSSFGAFQLPQAALLLRQGVGRLIRRRSDWGMVAILDQRVLTKGYGRVLLNSLPRCPTTTDFDKVVHHFGVRFNEN